jgi:4-amino-4-deoxy-L-arabinose transferase-like glycosyltransferase
MYVGQSDAQTPATSNVIWRNVWMSTSLLFVTSVLLRLIGLDHLPANDELYTVLAARGWLIHGVPQIADGIYDRALLYTILVAHFFQTLGESLAVARLPSVIAGSLLVVAVFLWTRSAAGNLAAWIAALFVCFSPLSIQLSQYARFYTIFALLFWLGAIGVYALVEQDLLRRARLALALGSLVCLGLAFHFQPLTVIGVLGLTLWLVAAQALPWLWTQRAHPERFWTVVGVTFVLLVIGSAFMIQSGIALEWWTRFRYAPLHALPRNQPWFYQLGLIERWPTLWPIFPFLALLALAVRPRPALFCCCVFIPVFALLSLAAMKHFIYIHFALPFLFVIWSIALARAAAPIARCVATTTDRALAQTAPTLPRRPASWALIGAGVLFLIISNGAPARTLLKPFGIALQSDETSIDWAPAGAALQPWLATTPIVLTPNDMHALYYLGDYDVAVNQSRLSEVGAEEFAIDRRTGRPVIASAAALALILDCYPSGLLVVDDTMYRESWALTDAMADLLERRTTPLAVTPGVRAFVWEQPPGDPAACAALPDSLPPPAAGRAS